MLILKGYCGKSTAINIIMNATNSICFVYDEYPILYNSICVDSREYSLENFRKCILEELKEAVAKEFERLEAKTVTPAQANEFLESKGTSPIS